MTTEITVRGEYSRFQQPERATVHASVTYQGPKMDAVYQRVGRDLNTLSASIVMMHDPDRGPVTWWSAQQISTWSNRPWNKDGKVLPPVHHASVVLQVKFREFGELSRWVGQHTENTEGFRVDRIEWALTEARKKELTADVSRRAVHDAAERAKAYAEALDLGPITPVAIADAGMLGDGLNPGGGRVMAYARESAGGSSDVDLVPEDVAVSASVDARFSTVSE